MSDRTVTMEDTISKLFAEKKFSVLKDVLATINGADIAAVFNGLEPESLPLLFRLLSKDKASECFVEMEPDVQEKLIKGLSDTELREIVNDLFVDDAVDIVEEMPADVVKRILAQADPQMRREINEVLKYPENSAGSLMTTEFVALQPEMTVRQALAVQVVLTAFIPMLMDTGGNSGSQSSVTVIRAISLGEVDWKDLPAVVWKEGRTAILCGLVLALACFMKLMVLDRMVLGNEDVTIPVALVVCSAMLVTVLVAKVIGCTLPLVAKKLRFAPAVMASPFITTIVDAVSLLVYFGIAKSVLF